MKKELAEKLVEIHEMYDEDCTLHETYSGRGMFGSKTYGISTKCDMMSMIIECADLFVDEDGEPLFGNGRMRTDQLGLGMIYY